MVQSVHSLHLFAAQGSGCVSGFQRKFCYACIAPSPDPRRLRTLKTRVQMAHPLLPKPSNRCSCCRDACCHTNGKHWHHPAIDRTPTQSIKAFTGSLALGSRSKGSLADWRLRLCSQPAATVSQKSARKRTRAFITCGGAGWCCILRDSRFNQQAALPRLGFSRRA